MARAFVLHGVECLLAGGKQDADQIHHRVGAVGSGEQRVGKTDIGLHGVDLSHAAERLQMARELRPAHGNPHARTSPGNGADHMAADEARTAIDGHERPITESDSHGSCPWRCC
jgi:hypothetical protein